MCQPPAASLLLAPHQLAWHLQYHILSTTGCNTHSTLGRQYSTSWAPLLAASGRILLRCTALLACLSVLQVKCNCVTRTAATCRPAVERFTGRVFQLPAMTFFPRHAALLAGLRGLLAPAELRPHAGALHQAACRHLAERWPVRGEVRM